MKKFLLSVFIILAACRSAPDEEKFVNPVFYKPLNTLAIKSDPWDMQMTPTQISFSRQGTVVSQKCILTTNQKEAVGFDCEGLYDRERREIIICKILPTPEYYSGTYVRCYNGNKEECENLPIDLYWSEFDMATENERRRFFGTCWPEYRNFLIHDN